MQLKDTAKLNSQSATKLQTARTINGTNFDGTGNITTSNWGTARNITIGNAKKSINGSADASWTLTEIGAAASNHTHSGYASSSHTHNYAGSSSAGGAANSAVKATQDSAGQQINTTYIKGLSVSGKTITYTKGDGTTGTLTTQDTNTTYSVGTASALGLTKLYTGTGTATDGTMTQSAINTALSGKAATSHTHNYAGSSSAGGAANSATKLATARTINGTSFDGSAAITTANWGTARTLTIGNTGKSVNGSGNVSWSLSEIGAFPVAGGTIKGNVSAEGDVVIDGDLTAYYGTTTLDQLYVYNVANFEDDVCIRDGMTMYIGQGEVYHPGNKPTASEIGAAAASHTHSYLPLSGGTVTGDTTFNQYIKINAWSGYGTGSADFWYNGNNKTVEVANASDMKLGGNVVLTSANYKSYVTSSSSANSLNFKAPHKSDWTSSTAMAGKTYMGGWHGALTSGSKGYVSIGAEGGTQSIDLFVDGDIYVNEYKKVATTDHTHSDFMSLWVAELDSTNIGCSNLYASYVSASWVSGETSEFNDYMCNTIDDIDGTAYWICFDSARGGNSQITMRPDTDNKGNIGHANWTWNYANITSVSNRSAIRPVDAHEVSVLSNNDEMYDMVKDMNFYIYKENEVTEYEEMEELMATEEYQGATEEEQAKMLKSVAKSTPSRYTKSKYCRITTNAEELPYEVAPVNENFDGDRHIDVVAFSTGIASALQKAISKIEELEQKVEELENR